MESYPCTKTDSLVAPSRDLQTLTEKTKAYTRGAKAPATLLAYRSDFRDFTRFCREHNLSFFPSTPETVALYITDCASRLASATITRRLTSITKAHQSAGCEDSPASTHHFIVSEEMRRAANHDWQIFPVSPPAKFSGNSDLLIAEATSQVSRLEKFAVEYLADFTREIYRRRPYRGNSSSALNAKCTRQLGAARG